jgi:murein DD-endopeptidase MepM/ murein hydrolase activator NlpD
MFHFRGPVDDWPRAVAILPDGYVIKSIDDVQMLAQTKSINPNLPTILRHYYQAQVPGDSVQDNYQRARDFFDTFIDGTFMNGETHGWNHAAATDYVEGWNEYFGNGMPPDERQNFIYWARAAAEIWATEYRTRPGMEHIRLILANTAVGNDIPIEVAQVAVQYDCLLGYHTYWPTRHNVVPASEWPWYSGRFTQMDAHFRANGLRVNWALTEAGALLYRGEWPEIGLNPNDGWLHQDCHGGNIEEYLTTITRWMNLWHSWNLEQGGRALPPTLFDSSRDGWELFQIHQPNLDRIAQHVAHWQPTAPPPSKSLEKFLWDLSIERQPISLNADALLQQVIFSEDRTPVESEEWVVYPGDSKRYAYQAGEDPTGARPRFVVAAQVPDPGQPWETFTFTDPNQISPPLPGLILNTWPTDYPFIITQEFWANPQNYNQYCDQNGLCLPGHNGVDMRAPLGSPFWAAVDGEVVWASDQRPSGGPSDYGWHVRVKSGDYTIIYAHAEPNLPVSVGDQVYAGQLIGRSGNTGNSYGPHLHFEMRHCGLSAPIWPWCIINATPYLEPLMN